MLTAPNGDIIEQYDYDAFGFPYFYDGHGDSLTHHDGPSNSERGYSPYGNRFLFTGREWLTDLKLYDYRNRMYQPELGRFLQPDPKQFDAGDYNLYRYCQNDPVNKNDPTGLKWDVPDSIKADFDAARAYLSADPGMKAIFDRIEAAPNVIHVVPSESLTVNPDQFQGTNRGNGSFEWNPRAAALFPNGEKQSPAMVLGHEAAHPERFIRDRNGYISDVSPAARDYTYGNREEKRVITGVETNAAKRLREGVRDSAKARFYKSEGVTSRKKANR
jgi:RHS repeat-associated protein